MVINLTNSKQIIINRPPLLKTSIISIHFLNDYILRIECVKLFFAHRLPDLCFIHWTRKSSLTRVTSLWGSKVRHFNWLEENFVLKLKSIFEPTLRPSSSPRDGNVEKGREHRFRRSSIRRTRRACNPFIHPVVPSITTHLMVTNRGANFATYMLHLLVWGRRPALLRSFSPLAGAKHVANQLKPVLSVNRTHKSRSLRHILQFRDCKSRVRAASKAIKEHGFVIRVPPAAPARRSRQPLSCVEPVWARALPATEQLPRLLGGGGCEDVRQLLRPHFQVGIHSKWLCIHMTSWVTSLPS